MLNFFNEACTDKSASKQTRPYRLDQFINPKRLDRNFTPREKFTAGNDNLQKFLTSNYKRNLGVVLE